jgi:hypothetical protein
MRRVRGLTAILAVAVVLACPAALLGQGQQGALPAEAFQAPEGLLKTLYASVSGTPDVPQDWDFVRSMFLEEATIVLRTSRTQTNVFSLDGFIEDFQQSMGLSGPSRLGFQERIVGIRPWVYRDMAHVLVLYEAHIPGAERPPEWAATSWCGVTDVGGSPLLQMTL